MKCPECGKEISSFAKRCPHCGREDPCVSNGAMIIINIILQIYQKMMKQNINY